MRILSMLSVAVILAVGLVSGCTLSPEQRQTVANFCQEGVKYYGLIQEVNAVEPVPKSIMNTADKAYTALKPICDKGTNFTEADLVIASLQAYRLAKAWTDSN